MSDSENEVNSGALLVDGAEVFKRNWPLLLVSGVATALAQAGQNLVDHQKLSGIGGVALAALVTLAVTYGISAVVSRGLLLREQIAAEDVPARFGAYFGARILVALGAGLGMLLLIVPGILLLLRWTLAANFTLARGMGVQEAMRASSDATDGHRSAIFGAMLITAVVIYVPYLVLIKAAGGLTALSDADLPSVIGVLRTGWTILGSMFSLALSIGIFSVLVGRSGHLREVFA